MAIQPPSLGSGSSWVLHTELLKSFTRHPTPLELTRPWLVALPWSLSLWFRPPATPSGAQSSGAAAVPPLPSPGPHIRSLSLHSPFSPPRSNDTAPTRLPQASPATSQLEPGSGRSADSIGMRGRSATGTAAACRRTDLGLLPTAVGWHRKGGWYLATSDRCPRSPALDLPGCLRLTSLYSSSGDLALRQSRQPSQRGRQARSRTRWPGDRPRLLPLLCLEFLELCCLLGL